MINLNTKHRNKLTLCIYRSKNKLKMQVTQEFQVKKMNIHLK